MTSYILKTPTKIPSNIDELYDASSMQVSAKGRSALNYSDEEDYLQKKLDDKRSIANLTSILHLVETELVFEKDKEIHTLLLNQKETLRKILSQKQTGKKSSFKTAENEVISQLQNQIIKLEKSVDEKFDIILKSIKNEQNTVKIYAQIASQNTQTADQNTQNQDANTSQNTQKEKQWTKVKRYTKSETKQAKLLAKQKISNYREKKLVIHVN